VPRLAKDGIPQDGQGRRGSYRGLCICPYTQSSIGSDVTYDASAERYRSMTGLLSQFTAVADNDFSAGFARLTTV
jgi:hypothetical protein